MSDYVDGKVDWMAYGLPVEGDDGPFLGSAVAPVPTCDVGLAVVDARRALAGAHADMVVVVHESGLAVGDVDGAVLQGKADDVPLLDVLRPVPSTVRPSVTVASVADGGGDLLVTTSDGRLLGRATVEDATPADAHEGHDHEGHDHEGDDHEGDDPIAGERYEQELADVMKALAERFGDTEPSAGELQSFLRDRLVAEGRSVEDAERFVADMGDGT